MLDKGGRGRKDKMDGSQSDGETKWPTVNLINTSSVLRERMEDRARPRKCQGRNNSPLSARNRVIEVDTPCPSTRTFLGHPVYAPGNMSFLLLLATSLVSRSCLLALK